MEYHSFLCESSAVTFAYATQFPSPCRVLFILIVVNRVFKAGASFVFPSPYGVSFILINRNFSEEESVSKDSFHLLTEYRSFLLKA